MKNDVHLIAQDEPFSFWGNCLTGICGKTIWHANVVFMFDEVAMGSSIRESLKGVCSKCLERIGKERYVYGIRGERESQCRVTR